jgi:hypothetical protein
VFVFSLFTYVASAGDDCTYTPTSWDWESKYQYHYGLKAESTWIGTPTAHITVQTEVVTFDKNGSVKIFINGNPVTLYTDSDLQNEVPLPIYPNNPTPNDHYNFDYKAGYGSFEFWLYTGFLDKPTTIRLKHAVADVEPWDDITWTLDVSCPPETGSIKITTEPDNAKWEVYYWPEWRGPYVSGQKVGGWLTGSKDIRFTDVDGCETPSDISVNVTANETVYQTVKYDCTQPNAGSIKVTIEPAKARDAGAKWKADVGGFTGWVGPIESGKTVNGFALGSTPISFTDVDSCTTPPDTSVIVKANDVVSVTGKYICPDVCSGKDCPGDVVTLKVKVNGDGTVTTSDNKNCSSGCQYQEGDKVTLTATPSSTFDRWRDCPNPSGNKCDITMGSSDKTVTAVFDTVIPPLDNCEKKNGCKLEVKISGKESQKICPTQPSCFHYNLKIAIVL